MCAAWSDVNRERPTCWRAEAAALRGQGKAGGRVGARALVSVSTLDGRAAAPAAIIVDVIDAAIDNY